MIDRENYFLYNLNIFTNIKTLGGIIMALMEDLLLKGLDDLKDTLKSCGVATDNILVKLTDSQKSEYEQDWTEQEGSNGGNKEQKRQHKEKELQSFEKLIAQAAEEENGNV